MTQAAEDRESVLQTVRQWPPEEQESLAREILRGLHAEEGVIVEPPLAPPDSRGLAGLLATDRPPPTDEEVEQWLDEHRMEKYGG